MGANRSIKAEVDQVVTADLDVIEAKCGREYTDQVRLCFYDMVASGVSVNKCSDLLQNILAEAPMRFWYSLGNPYAIPSSRF